MTIQPSSLTHQYSVKLRGARWNKTHGRGERQGMSTMIIETAVKTSGQ